MALQFFHVLVKVNVVAVSSPSNGGINALNQPSHSYQAQGGGRRPIGGSVSKNSLGPDLTLATRSSSFPIRYFAYNAIILILATLGLL